MSNRPLYQGAGQARVNPGMHTGLWFEKFFDAWETGWEKPSPTSKERWLEQFLGDSHSVRSVSCGDSAQLLHHSKRQKNLCRQLGGEAIERRNNWRFITGMGLPHPLENGIAWHPTLGVPWLAGSGVKGMVRAFCEVWDENCDQKWIRRIFGPSTKELEEGANHASGEVIFFDALPVEPVDLVPEVMTPHAGKWYEKGGGDDPTAPDTVPADWHDPNPIVFLVFKRPVFLFSWAPRPGIQLDSQATEKIHDALTNALELTGAGAKTAVGFGHFDLLAGGGTR